MFYEDLLNAKYTPHGRSIQDGFDCYGLVIECCKRAGTPIKDLWYEGDRLDCGKAGGYIAELNLIPIDKPEVGCIVECDYNGNLHCGYMVDDCNLIHTTKNGVKLTAINFVKIKNCYRARG